MVGASSKKSTSLLGLSKSIVRVVQSRSGFAFVGSEPFFTGVCWPVAICLQRMHGCWPSNVCAIAFATEARCEYSTSMLAQAKDCRAAQCPPIETESASMRTARPNFESTGETMSAGDDRNPGVGNETVTIVHHNWLRRVLIILCLVIVVDRRLRLFISGMIFASLQALASPGVSAPFAQQERMSCCQESSTPPEQDCGDKHQPLPSPSVPCCPGCAMVLTPFLAPIYPPAFSPDAGETCSLGSLIRLGRSERPPVPPPRAQAS